LPEATDETAARNEIARRHDLEAAGIAFRALPGFVHGFSHYLLEVTPLALDLAPVHAVADAADRRWLHPHEAAALGLPAPVRKLIQTLS
jgi:A/G-specific adenine glycosylase